MKKDFCDHANKYFVYTSYTYPRKSTINISIYCDDCDYKPTSHNFNMTQVHQKTLKEILELLLDDKQRKRYP